MADQTSLIAGLAGGLGVGLALVVLLGVCVYYQHKKIKKKTKDSGYLVNSDNVNSVTAAPKGIPQDTTVQQAADVDLNPETGQPLPMFFEASAQGVAFAPQQPTSVVSPIFLQPSLAFNSNAGASNPFMNRLYPQPDGVPYGNDALLPEMGPMPSRFGRVGFHRSTSWLGPQQQLQQQLQQQQLQEQLQQQQLQEQLQQQQQLNAYHDYNPMNRQPVVEDGVQRNVQPLGSNERFAFSDGEEIERKKKKKRRTNEVEFVVREDTSKYKHRRSRRHSSSDSSSESDSSGSDSDSSTESESRLRIIQPGTDSFYLVEDGKNKKKKKHKKIIAMIPQARAPALQPAPVQPSPPPPPPPPPPPQPNPPPQPMIFILPSGCQQQQVEQPRVPEYEVKPVSVPAPTIPQGSAFWSADGQVNKKPAFFKAGGGTGNAEYETQERSAQIGDDNVDYGLRRMNIQIAASSRAEQSFAGYSGGGCTSCEAGGGSYGGGGYEMSAGSGGGYGRTGVAYGSAQGGAVQPTSGTSQDGYEEAGYSMNF